MVVEDARDEDKELRRISGYVGQIGEIAEGMIEVRVNEDGTWKHLIMPVKLFEEQGILGEDMRFIYRV